MEKLSRQFVVDAMLQISRLCTLAGYDMNELGMVGTRRCEEIRPAVWPCGNEEAKSIMTREERTKSVDQSFSTLFVAFVKCIQDDVRC